MLLDQLPQIPVFVAVSETLWMMPSGQTKKKIYEKKKLGKEASACVGVV